MGDDGAGTKPRATGNLRSALSPAEVRAFTTRAPRCKVVLAVLFIADEGGAAPAELVNVSSSGMFVATGKAFQIGTPVRFQFRLDDTGVALSGSAVVVRRELHGMGLRFVALDQAGQDLVARLVDAAEGMPDPPPGEIAIGHGAIRVRLTAATAGYFTYNPLLHVGVGGCFLPAGGDIALGTGFELTVVDQTDQALLRCSAKVAALQEARIGLRFIDPDRAAIQALRAAIARLDGRAGPRGGALP